MKNEFNGVLVKVDGNIVGQLESIELVKTVPKINASLVDKTKEFLGPIGIAFFIGVKKHCGCVDAVWNESGLPHPVHFREGVQIRNFMRGQEECEGWEDHDFDEYWVELIERCIGEE